MRYGDSDFYTDENRVLKNKFDIKSSKELEKFSEILSPFASFN